MNFPITMTFTSGAAFLLGFLLLFQGRKFNLEANRFLGLFMFTLALTILEVPLFYQNFNLRHPYLFEAIGLLRFLTSPFLYLSILFFTSLKRKFEVTALWHFLPFFIFCLFRLPFFITGKNIRFSYETGQIVFFILKIALPLQTIIYWLLSFVKLQKHIKNIKQFSSEIDQINLKWLTYFLLILLVIVTAWFNLVFFNLKALIPFTPLLYLLSIFFLAYFSLQQKEIFNFNNDELRDLSSIKVYKTENPKRVSGNRLKELDAKLKTLIEEEKVYLENDLNLPRLAKRMEASSNETSFIINELYQDNFYNFINKYRIEEAKLLLLSKKYNKLSIVGIAYESGFNSKTTFNTTFKKYVGQSPTEFVKGHKNLLQGEI